MRETESFGPWLKQRRKDLDLTQEELAEAVGCSPETVRKLEAGARRPSKHVAELLARFLDIPPEEHAAFVRFARGDGAVEAGTSSPASAAADRVEEPALAAGAPAPTNLKEPLTPLIGRAQAVATVRGLLLRDDVRLLTLTGPPGIGKTRLATHVACQLLNHFPDGVFFVPLADVTRADLVLPTIARVLDLKEHGAESAASVLGSFLRKKQMLLFLDNLEQVLDAAVSIVDLLVDSPGVKVLVTSREALSVRGESLFAVAPLALPERDRLPDVEVLAQYPAITLFQQRAAAAKHNFVLTEQNAAAVAEICARLDGLPLAIELVAARVTALPPGELAARLRESGGPGALRLLGGGPRDLPARHQTMRAAVEWSFNLLDGPEQTLFSRLGVFAGGWTLAAAEAVCLADGELPLDMLDGLSSLVDKSLVVAAEVEGGEARFVMLQTIREYARERLVAAGEMDHLQRWHAAYFLRLGEAAEPHLAGEDQALWLNRLEPEIENIRAALGWWLEHAEVEPAGRMGAALYRFWWMRGLWSEGRKWLDQVLSQGEESGALSPGLEAKVLNHAASLALAQADYTPAIDLCERALAVSRRAGDTAGMARALGNLGTAMSEQGNYARAAQLLEEARRIEAELGNGRNLAVILTKLGALAYGQGDLRRAQELMRQALDAYRELADYHSIAILLLNLGVVLYELGSYDPASAFWDEGLGLGRKLESKYLVGTFLNAQATIANRQQDHNRAWLLYVEALPLLHEIGDRQSMARVMVGIAESSRAMGQAERAARLLGAAGALFATLGEVLPPTEQADFDRQVAAAREAVGEGPFAAEWERGGAMSLEQAVEYALGR